MPKTLPIIPEEVRKPNKITFSDIPVNTYQKTVKDEMESFTKNEFINIYRDMCYIHEFESMLHIIKTTSNYQGITYTHPGPCHLGIGQEAMYVGEAFNLTLDDFIFGSHRSHGEILAKGLRSIEILDDKKLLDIIENYFDGNIYSVIKDSNKTVKEVARDFLLYGTMCEIFGKANGLNKGLGGSMHAFFIPFGIYPNNAIVGGSGSIAPGAALYKLINKKPGIIVCNLGDGAMSCGPVWEGLMISSMDQVRTLWGEDGGGVPIIFNINDNFYAMGGQTMGETMGTNMMARIGSGIMTSQMHAERIDGYNPLAVIDAYKRKMPVAKREGPVLLDIVTYRVSGHSPADPFSCRTKEEVKAWENENSIDAFGKQLVEANICTEKELDYIKETVRGDIKRNLKLAVDMEISPRIDLKGFQANFIENLMFSNKQIESLDTSREPKILLPKEECPRIRQIAGKSRYAFDENGKPIAKPRLFNMRDAVMEPIIDKFYEDPTFVSFGEDLRDYGGSFGVYREITDAFPYNRLFNTPIAEAGIVGAAIGYAMSGGRVATEVMFIDFMGRSGDEIINQLPKWQAMSAGLLKMPVVIRMSVGSTFGAQHAQDLSAICAAIPGLKVVFPVTPYDAKGLMQSALNGTDPVIFLEAQQLYDTGEQFHKGGVPEGKYEIPIGEPDVKRAGNDITILSIGATLYRAIDAADILYEKYDLSVEIIDARSLVPFNYEKVIESVKKTGRIVITGDACERNSFMRNIASNVAELCFDYLDAPPVVVGAHNWITPPSELTGSFYPQPGWIIDAIHERILPLKNHICYHNFTELEQIRRNKIGV
ncbi:MAG: alpha-ketoacid dehydrogenase subunit alpha/beta [Acetivibrionales bacterium]|jgi:2-oxoisovalerate dehydrogenase E1 component